MRYSYHLLISYVLEEILQNTLLNKSSVLSEVYVQFLLNYTGYQKVLKWY